jgi:hypothetical protein
MSEQQCAQCLNYNGQVVPWGEDFSGPAICRHCYEMDLRGDAETNRRVPGYYERNMALAEALHEGEADCGFLARFAASSRDPRAGAREATRPRALLIQVGALINSGSPVSSGASMGGALPNRGQGVRKNVPAAKRAEPLGELLDVTTLVAHVRKWDVPTGKGSKPHELKGLPGVLPDRTREGHERLGREPADPLSEWTNAGVPRVAAFNGRQSVDWMQAEIVEVAAGRSERGQKLFWRGE